MDLSSEMTYFHKWQLLEGSSQGNSVLVGGSILLYNLDHYCTRNTHYSLDINREEIRNLRLKKKKKKYII